MADEKFTTLASIFQMMMPSDLVGVPQVRDSNQKIDSQTDFLLKTVLERPGGGALTVSDMLAALNNSANSAKTHSSIRFFSSEGNLSTSEFNWQMYNTSESDPNKEEIFNGTFNKMVGLQNESKNKKFALIISDESFISPAVLAARQSEIFFNFMPSFIISRCVPYLSAEFIFDRSVYAQTSDGNDQLNAPGLLKFLIGPQIGKVNGIANEAMLDGNTLNVNDISNTSAKEISSKVIAGMEMFTAPQTLLNFSPGADGSRYVKVLDPTRPLASLESVTINVTPTVGLMSYKTADLVLKLHDRSRLSEIADLIKPLIYTKTTVWLTYGWRHPKEINNPYAEFVNNNMLVREAYGIANSAYSFDQAGQVTITLKLYTKGVRELRDIKITDGVESFEHILRKMSDTSDLIKKIRKEQRLEKPTGILQEIRGHQILDAAENGSLPDLKITEVLKEIENIDKSLNSVGNKIPDASLSQLKNLLKEVFATDTKKQKFVFNERFEQVSNGAVQKLFNSVQSGPDLFLMTQKKNDERKKQLKIDTDHPFTDVIQRYNKTVFRSQTDRENKKQYRKLVSFGKLFTTFFLNGISAIDGIDEVQTFFYCFNNRAGKAAETNIAEFPIDMHVFLDQFQKHVSTRRTDKISLEEFLKLVIDAQLGDIRGPGYDFFASFAPYDPANKDAKLRENDSGVFTNNLAQKENKYGPFLMPVIDMFVETTFVSKNSNSQNDLLAAFDAQALDGRRDDTYVKVLRVHIFDKTINPYPLASALLKGDSAQGYPQFLDVKNKLKNIIKPTLDSHPELAKYVSESEAFGITVNDGSAYETIKKLVSMTIPTIIHGANGSIVKEMNITTKQDALLSTTQMMAGKSGRPGVTQPNGGGTLSLPLRIIPAAITLNSLGNPLVRYAQMYFIDVNTGTSIDNCMGVVGLTHTITPGSFMSSMNLVWMDSYGQFESPQNFLKYLGLIEE